MDEALGDEVAPVDAVEGALLHSKEGEYSLRAPESSSMLESREMVIPCASDYPESSFHVLVDILEGKNVNSSVSPLDVSEQPCAVSCYTGDATNMVEELTVRNYNGSNLAIVRTSNSREKMQTLQSPWQHLGQLGAGSGSGDSQCNTFTRDNDHATPSVWENVRYASFPEFLGQKTSNNGGDEVMEQSPNTECIGVSGSMVTQRGIRTKILSKSGFSEFFVKKTLKGKGIIFRGPPHDSTRIEPRDQNNGNTAGGISTSNASLSSGVKTAIPSSFGICGPWFGGLNRDGVSLREWLNARQHKVKKIECLHIFRQIVDMVDYSHSQGVALLDLRPSCFKLLQSHEVKYLGSAVRRDMLETAMDQEIAGSENLVIKRRSVEQGMFPSFGIFAKKQKFSENMNYARWWPQFTAKHGFKFETANDEDVSVADTQNSLNESNEHSLNAEYGIQGKSSSHQLSNMSQQQLASGNDRLEVKWYASPEELSKGICTVASNIYSLGVLLFELLGCFNSERAHATVMLDLRHRILPPDFLSENPKEAGFCLWLLHPEPSSRPTTREILQSEVINGLQEVSAEELASSISQDDMESELLLHFLISLKEHKQKQASKLVEDIRCLDVDSEEVWRRNCLKKQSVPCLLGTNYVNAGEHGFQPKDPPSSDILPRLPCSSNTNEMRFMSNMSQLESAYFTMRSQIQHSETNVTTRQDNDLLTNRENWDFVQGKEKQNSTYCHGAFFEGLCKYARYSKLEVRGLLRTGDFNNSANVICSLSFDRDEEYFAAAGVSKKIKIFEFNALFDDSVDVHYPVGEMSNKSKLSCICWNHYIKNFLASTDYDGVVKLWDASTGQGVCQYMEHEKRAWSVDFSQVYPTKLASGGDDCSVKLWSINDKNCFGTIRNVANVCCVQFSPHSGHLLAFGSADYKTYCYDLRNVRTPWCALAGHDKAVSYVKFLDTETVVTASTDNSLKLWNLNRTCSSGQSTAACSLTFSGHTNEKNFVGLSTADGYIACGSETNEVFVYYRSLPMPMTSHKFGSIDPISGKETDDDNGQFVSSVCWRGKSDMVVSANSSGCIKVLQMV